MLDIHFITEHKEIVKLGARKKHVDIDIDLLLSLDTKRRAGDTSVLPEWQRLMLTVPNMPDITVPDGTEQKNNVPLRTLVSRGAAPLREGSLAEHFGLPLAFTPLIVNTTELVCAGLHPKSERIVPVSDTQFLSPHPLVPLLTRGEDGATIASACAYGEGDTVYEERYFTLLRCTEGTHSASVDAYNTLVSQLDALLEESGVAATVSNVCSGQLALAEVAATEYVYKNLVIARAAYHHDFLARRAHIKLGGQLAHTCTLSLNLSLLSNATT